MDMEATLDNWKPNFPEKKLVQSDWRKQQNKNDFNQEVGRDELKKIKLAIKNKFPDHEIMQTYGISAETLVRVKENKINPELGEMRGTLNYDSESKDINALFKKVNKLQDSLYGIKYALKELSKILFSEEEYQKEFLKLMNKKPEKPKKIKKESEL